MTLMAPWAQRIGEWKPGQHITSLQARNACSRQTSSWLPKAYATRLTRAGLPVIFTLRHLAKITSVEYGVLRATVERRRESANYRMFAVKKEKRRQTSHPRRLW